MWYLSIKNWLIIISVVLAIAFSGLFLWQRTTIAKQNDKIGDLQVLTADLQGQIVDYKANIVALKKLQQQQQQVQNDTTVLLTEVNRMLETKCIGANDEKTFSDVTYFFNSRGLLTARSTEASGEVLPKPSSTNIGGWTTKQVAENYLILIDYTLKLERTVSCYDSN